MIKMAGGVYYAFAYIFASFENLRKIKGDRKYES